MKSVSSLKVDPSKGDKLVRRRGVLFVLNDKDPTRKRKQKGRAFKRAKNQESF